MKKTLRSTELINICNRLFCNIKQNIEPIGLFLILTSFGWQCFEEHSNSTIYEAHILNINEKLNAIWATSYDEFVHSERYQEECLRNGRVSLYWFNYDAANRETFIDWNNTKEKLRPVEAQKNIGWRWRVVLYILGSVLVIIPKIKK